MPDEIGTFTLNDPLREMLHGESPDRRRTARAKVLLSQNIHPLTMRPLAQNGETCGTCAHHWVHQRSKRYHKCDLKDSSSAATDIRVSWPACQLWEACPHDSMDGIDQYEGPGKKWRCNQCDQIVVQ